MQPLGINTPSILLKISNKTILEYYIENLKDFVSEFIIIINKMQEQIIDFCNNKFKEENIIFFEELNEKNPSKTLKNIEKLIQSDFILITKEQIFDKLDVKELIKKKNSILVNINEDKNEIDEHNLFFLSKKNLDFVDDLIDLKKKKNYNEINNNNNNNNENNNENKDEYKIDFNLIKAKKNHYKIKYSWDLLKINEEINKYIENQIEGIIEDRATIKENIILGKNSIIKNGVYIEGPCVIGANSIIGPNCYIRPYTSIGNNCKIGNAVEIKNSIIMDNTNVGHLSYIGDSIIGKNSNMGAGTITSNLRHDKKLIKTIIDNNLIESNRKKFGTIIAENVHTGIHTSIYPGRKIWPNKSTIPGEIVKNDII